MALLFPISCAGKKGGVSPCQYQGCEVADPTKTYAFNADCSINGEVDGNVPTDWQKSDANVTSIYIGTNTTSFGNSSFRWCVSLERIWLPAHLTTTGSYAFWGCDALHTVTILGSITMSAYSFRYCNALTRLNVCTASPPSGFSGGTYGTFADCPNLTEVHVPENGWEGVNTWIGLTVVKDLPAI